MTNAPRSRAGGPAKLIGTLVIVVLIVMILLLATGLVNFEAAGWFGA